MKIGMGECDGSDNGIGTRANDTNTRFAGIGRPGPGLVDSFTRFIYRSTIAYLAEKSIPLTTGHL